MKTKYIFLFCAAAVFCAACTNKTDNADLRQMRYLSEENALMWPDYTDCTLPANIAPLNFYLLPQHKSFTLRAWGMGSTGDTLRIKGQYKVTFPPQKWHKLLEKNQGGEIAVNITLNTAKGKENHNFTWPVRDSIDPYFCCRLIEPSYQTSSLLQTIEFNLQDASQRLLFDNRLQEVGCENCHTCAQNNGDYLVYHVRFDRTGTFIVTPEKTVRVNMKSKRFPQGGVYPTWHPNKNLIAFGSSSAYPFVHSKDIVRRTEVYDSFGDIILYDIARNFIFSDERLTNPESEETFPFWSWDGKWLYVCQSPNPLRDPEEDDVDFSKKIRYNLIRVAFDESACKFGKIDTVINKDLSEKTVSFPRLSPNGRWLVVCLSDHGTFPIRHPESDLYILDLEANSAHHGFERVPGFMFPVKKMENVNSRFTESYHSWSSESRWLMISSKKEDNLYSRPYFSYVDENGNSSKSFMLPQKDPKMYLAFLKSFNVPEFAASPIKITAAKAHKYSVMPVIVPDSTRIYTYEK